MNNKKATANKVKIELISASRTGVRVKLVLSETAQTEISSCILCKDQ